MFNVFNATFEYEAINEAGEDEQGTIDLDIRSLENGRKEAEDWLFTRGLIIKRIRIITYKGS